MRKPGKVVVTALLAAVVVVGGCGGEKQASGSVDACTAKEKAGHTRVVEAMDRAKQAHAAWAVYQGGKDDAWADYYASFLVEKSPLASLLGVSLTDTSVSKALTALDERYTKAAPSVQWPEWYASHLCENLPGLK